MVVSDWILLVGLCFRLIYNKFSEKYRVVKKIGPQDFNLPQNVIDIIYSQTLCW